MALVLSALLLTASPAPAEEGRVPLPHPAKAYKGDRCVEPVDVMRRQHMNYLLHQRDETVRGGIRGAKYSLRQCIECHAVPDKAAAGARTVRSFCGECHSYAAVGIDCFECHTTKVTDAMKSDKAFSGAGESRMATLAAELERYLSEGSARNVRTPR